MEEYTLDLPLCVKEGSPLRESMALTFTLATPFASIKKVWKIK